MKNFFNLLKASQAGGNFVAISHTDGWQLPPEIRHSTECSKCPVVQGFFDGNNVCFENISTRNGFSYQATVSSEDNCTEEEFVREVDAGLKELGLKAKTSVSKKETAKRNNNNNYIVTIQVCS